MPFACRWRDVDLGGGGKMELEINRQRCRCSHTGGNEAPNLELSLHSLYWPKVMCFG